MDEKPRLTCEQCRQRKRKCDKGVPCSACKIAGLRCEVVQRARLPRGRTAKAREKNRKLEDRVARIESLLTQAGSKSAHDGDAPTNGHSAPNSATEVGGLIAPAFWSALTREVTSLRGTIEGTDEDPQEDEDELDSSLRSCGISDNSNGFLFADHASTKTNLDDARILASRGSSLFQIFLDRVDNVFKLLHWPSAMEVIQASHHDSKSTDESRAAFALELSIQFMAICTMSENECRQLSNESQHDFVISYKSAVEAALSQTDLLRSPTITAVQAFVIYLLGIRACGMYATHWTYVALLLRIGTGLGLGTESASSSSILDLEIRRRLWYCICILDTQAALDRGTPPIVHPSDLGPPPQDIDDDVLSGQPSHTRSPGVYTVMSVSMISYEAMKCHLQICDAARKKDTSWEFKTQIVAGFEKSIYQRFILNKIPETPLDQMCLITARGITANLQLLLRRPLYKQKNAIPPSDDFDILQVAATTMEKHLGMQSSQFAGWAWKIWPPWYAMAVVLAELCKPDCRGPTDRAYDLCIATYRRYARPSHDPECGILWKPIAKLLRRVRLQRNKMIRSTEASEVDDQSENRSASTVTLPDALEPWDSAGNVSMDWDPLVADPDGAIYADMDLPGLYDQLDPMNGISWLDWDSILGDDETMTKTNYQI